MATKIEVAELVVKLTADSAEMARGLSGATRQAARWAVDVGRTVVQTGLKVVAAGAIAATAAVTALGGAMVKLALDAAPLQGIGNVFETFAQRGVISLDALREASRNAIPDFELMRTANEALAGASEELQGPLGEALPRFLEIARAAALATGKDFNFLFASLVSGVKRNSPLLIDNAQIALSASEAYDRFAEANGLAADSLTKEQQQLALLNEVLRQGQPMVDQFGGDTLTAAEGMAQLGAIVKNTRDRIGLALQPALHAIIAPLSGIADKVGPRLIAWAEMAGQWLGERIPIAVEALRGIWEKVWPIVQEKIEEFWPVAQNIFDSLVKWFKDDLPVALETLKGIWSEVWSFIETDIIPIAQDFLVVAGEVWAFIEENLTPILAGLAAVIAALVIPAFITWASTAIPMATIAITGFITAFGPAILVIGAIGAAVALLVAAWERDWGGIRTTITDFWENTGRPIFESIKEWLEINIPIAIETLKGFWENTLLPAIQIVWGFIQEDVIPLLEALAEVVEAILGKALEVLAGLWENVLQPALETVWGFIQENIIPIFEDVAELIGGALGDKLSWLGETLLPPIQTAFEKIGDAIAIVVKWLKDLATKISDLELPDWLTTGSPTPLEMGIRGIGDAMKDLSNVELPTLAASISAVGAVGRGETTNTFTMNINGPANRQGVIQGFETMRALVGP